jgi:hypothetical protein
VFVPFLDRRCVMKTAFGVGTVLAFVLLGGTAHASYPAGIYVRVHDVKYEGDDASPTAVKIYGDFVLAMPGLKLSEAKRGVMYFSIVPGKESVCRAEWADLKKMASTDLTAANYVGFGSTKVNNEDADDATSRANRPKVHEKESADLKPVPYPLNTGLIKLRPRATDDDDNGLPVARLRLYREKNPLPADKK